MPLVSPIRKLATPLRAMFSISVNVLRVSFNIATSLKLCPNIEKATDLTRLYSG